MRIFAIEVFRDGGSIEFTLEKNGTERHVWLETPIYGEPRTLLINSSLMASGCAEVAELLADMDHWWSELPEKMRALVDEIMDEHNPSADAQAPLAEAIDLTRVVHVHNYVLANYSATPDPQTPGDTAPA
ncbi:hypothetical protein [Silvimonas iriomotensis]|uniref:Uncharacterized protein n=1 Tax=Silvimonas iriomotensis TaxID=449662 RepID=A0ABQ2P8X2_9NEIS|nr:hypothetical protein [Silvimonas iriomotensis]GGP21208.1 hypothetical protein GCM10010970_19350 [Silvimonas iriomotensis]